MPEKKVKPPKSPRNAFYLRVRQKLSRQELSDLTRVAGKPIHAIEPAMLIQLARERHGRLHDEIQVSALEVLANERSRNPVTQRRLDQLSKKGLNQLEKKARMQKIVETLEAIHAKIR